MFEFDWLPWCLSVSLETSLFVSCYYRLRTQDVYHVTHQCFYSKRSLYLALFRLSDGMKGIAELEPWLRNVQVNWEERKGEREREREREGDRQTDRGRERERQTVGERETDKEEDK